MPASSPTLRRLAVQKQRLARFFCALNCLTRIRAGFGICQHDCGNDSSERRFISQTVGPSYLVMELIEGATLKRQVPLNQALNYSAQIVTPLTLFTKGIPQWRSEARKHSGDQSRPNHSHRGCGSPSRPKCEVRDGLARMRQPKSDALMSEVQRGE